MATWSSNDGTSLLNHWKDLFPGNEHYVKQELSSNLLQTDGAGGED